MGILLTKIRIKNFRSIELIDINLGLTNLLIGQNNSGKTNFLRAINVALGGIADVSVSDIFVMEGEHLTKKKSAIIDIMFTPTDDNGKLSKSFSDFWAGVFTESWITTSVDSSFVGIRTEIKLDIAKDSYILNRKCIRQWESTIELAQLDSRKLSFNEDMRGYISAFYMDANRDIVQDLRNKKSFFGRVTSCYDMHEDKVSQIETQLSSVNAMIVESIPSLQQTKDKIATIGRTIGSGYKNVEIEPLTRKISDLNRGMDIVIQDGGASFPISQNGQGTRSWISFLTLSAFVENQRERLKAEDNEVDQYVMLTMEEPEAHLHPQAQRQLFSQIKTFIGQKVISTHSPSVVAQSKLDDAIYFSKCDGKTIAKTYRNSSSTNDGDLIFREVINTRAELLFSSATILCEGITEELVLPIYFLTYFGCTPFSLGVSIINTGGQKYAPYLELIKTFNIPWFIFSDGEEESKKLLDSVINKIFNSDYRKLSNVIVLSDNNDYETYLIREGYGDIISEAICEYQEEENYLDEYMEKNHEHKRKKKIAKKLGLNIVRDYSSPDASNIALKEVCWENKTAYALPVAKKIVSHKDKNKRIPSMVVKLFDNLAIKLGVSRVTQLEE